MSKLPAAQALRRKTVRRTDAGGIGALLPGHYLLLKTRKDKRALATAFGRLPKAQVIKTLSNAPAKNRIAGAHS